MSVTLRSGMVLAAGLGTRMRPLTLDMPKPLLPLGGRSLLDHALDRLSAAGIGRVVVNAHWQAEQIAARLRARTARHPGHPELLLQEEPERLDTGGAVLAALRAERLPAEAPFAVVNGDSFWLDGPTPALARLAGGFDPAAMDAMLLVARTAGAVGEVGAGDFAVDAFGRVRRPGENEIVPYVYAGVQVLAPRLFAGIGPDRFGLNAVWERAIGAGRLRAIVHDGPWFHLSRPADLAEAERALRDPAIGPTNT